MHDRCEAGVPVVPGSDGPVTDLAEAHRVAEEIGYPILVKAAGGGGGIGMALVKKASKLEAAISSCRIEQEQLQEFCSLFRKIHRKPSPHQVQVLFDEHMQRPPLRTRVRFNADIKEWLRKPHPLRQSGPCFEEAICGATMQAAKPIDYTNAGTVEFVMAPDGSFYFIEMNTRLRWSTR